MNSMNISKLTRLASFVLAVGFFVSCTSSQFTVDNLIEQENYALALEQIDQELTKNPTAELYIQKAEVLGKIAVTREAENRDSLYNEFDIALENATDNNLDSSALISQKIDSISTKYWNIEHQSGLQAYESDNEQVQRRSILHFQNALIIDSENVETYKSLAIAHYNFGNIEEAISTLNIASSLDQEDSEIYENLGFLYLETGNAQQSAYYYKLANKDPLKDKNIAFGLVNAYISEGNDVEAIKLLDQLVNVYPNNGKIHNVYGTQLFNQVSTLFPQLKDAYTNADEAEVTTLRVEIEGLSEKAEQQLIEAYKTDSNNMEFIESLAVFYNNMAGNYFSLHPQAFEDDKEAIKNRALTLTDFAIRYYNEMLEMEANNDRITTKITNLNTLKNSWNNK